MCTKKLKAYKLTLYTVLAIMIFSYSIIMYPLKDFLQYAATVAYYKNSSFEEIIPLSISYQIFFDEIVWKFLLYILSKTLLSPAIVIYLIALASFLIIITSVHKFAGVLVTSILFLNPIIQNLVLSQLRSSLVCAILCLALTKSKSRLILLTPFIHFSSYIYLIAMCFSKNFNKYQDLLLNSLFFLIIFTVLCYIRLNIPTGIIRLTLVNNISYAFKIAILSIPILYFLISIFKFRRQDYFGSFLIYIILAIIFSPFLHTDISRLYSIVLPIITIYIYRLNNPLLNLIFSIYMALTSLLFCFLKFNT